MATPAQRPPLVPKELAALLGCSARFVCQEIRAKRIPTLYPHRRPYKIPGHVLFKLGVEEAEAHGAAEASRA